MAEREDELQDPIFREDELRNNILNEEEVHQEMFRDGNFYEETAAEFAPQRPQHMPNQWADDRATVTADNQRVTTGTGLGITALILSILSLLFMPVTLGTVGIVVGIIAFVRGSRGLGSWAIGIGAISLINQFFFAPMLF